MDTRVNEAIKLRAQGKTLYEISKIIHARYSRVRSWVLSVTTDPIEKHIREHAKVNKTLKRRDAPGTVKKRISKLRSEGKSYTEISKELGVSKGTINYWCKKLGISKLVYSTNKHSRNILSAGAEAKKQAGIYRESFIKENVSRLLNKLSNPKFTAGLAWYMAEGNRSGCTGFCNQNPEHIRFMKSFFETYFPDNTVKYTIMINMTRWEERDRIVVTWKKLLGCNMDKVLKLVYKPGKRAQTKYKKDRDKYLGVCKQDLRGKHSTFICLVIEELWKIFINTLPANPLESGV